MSDIIKNINVQRCLCMTLFIFHVRDTLGNHVVFSPHGLVFPSGRATSVFQPSSSCLSGLAELLCKPVLLSRLRGGELA